jgi:hypothetical protein
LGFFKSSAFTESQYLYIREVQKMHMGKKEVQEENSFGDEFESVDPADLLDDPDLASARDD